MDLRVSLSTFLGKLMLEFDCFTLDYMHMHEKLLSAQVLACLLEHADLLVYHITTFSGLLAYAK